MPKGHIFRRKISWTICYRYMGNSLVMESYGYERKLMWTRWWLGRKMLYTNVRNQPLHISEVLV